MTIAEQIKAVFSSLGTMTDEGALLFAVDNNLDAVAEATDETLKTISTAFDSFITTYAMRSSSVSENGFSMSWSGAQRKGNLLLMLSKYGIKLTAESAQQLGLSVIQDKTNLW